MQEKKSSVGTAVAILAISLLIAGGVVAAALIISNNNSDSNEPVKASKSVDEPKKLENDNPGILSTDHVRGKRDSKVLVVEYADPQCPGCATMMPKMDAIYEKYKDKVAFVYRHYPIAGHQNAVSAAVAIEAAGKQGYFWEMYESLYTNRNSWVEKTGEARTNTLAELFAGAAKGGDVEKFRADLSDENILKKIDFDYTLGKDYDHVTATPSIYVNGEWIDITNIKTFDEVEEAVCNKIDIALGKKPANSDDNTAKESEEAKTEANAE